MPHQKIYLDIKGMHCRSCEILLERDIAKVEGVKKVKTDHKKGKAEIEYGENRPDSGALERAVEAAGYSLGKDEKKHFFSRNPVDYVELGAAATLVFLAYVILDSFGIFGWSVNASPTPSLLGVLLIGLTAGVSTCMALIGGLVLGVSSRHAERHPEATIGQKFRPHVYFNLGRLISYIVLGGFIGLIGSVLNFSASVLGLLTAALGIVMLFLGVKLIEIFPRLHNKSIALPKSLSRLFGLQNEMKEYSHRGAFLTGALTFFVPCGFTQAMQLYAVSTGSFAQGALIMGIFALGTLPGIASIGGLTSAIKGTFARYFFKFAGVVVILLAFFNVTAGLSLAGFSVPSWRSGESLSDSPAAVTIVDGKQVIEMTQTRTGYSPRQFTIKKGIPVVWKIKSTNQYTCAAYISMPSAQVATPLRPGENIIEFTPTDSGPMRFTCSMGMYSGSFNVID